MRASLAASSASVGKFWDTGGVTPYFLGGLVAMMAVLMLQSAAIEQGSKDLSRDIDYLMNMEMRVAR